MNEPKLRALAETLQAAAANSVGVVVVVGDALDQAVFSERAIGLLSLHSVGPDRLGPEAWCRVRDRSEGRSDDAGDAGLDGARLEVGGAEFRVQTVPLLDLDVNGYAFLLRDAGAGLEPLADLRGALGLERLRMNDRRLRHEVRGLLNSLILNLEVARRRSMNDPQASVAIECVGKAMHEARQVERVIRDWPMPLPELEDALESIDVRAIMASVERTVSACGISAPYVEIVPTEVPVTVIARPQCLRRILTEIVLHLADASGGGAVRFSAARSDGDAARIDLTAERKTPGGRGIDVDQVAKIVALMGGTIETTENGTLSVRISLPMVML